MLRPRSSAIFAYAGMIAAAVKEIDDFLRDVSEGISRSVQK